MPNWLAHAYFALDLNTIWFTLQNDIDVLDEYVARIIQENFSA